MLCRAAGRASLGPEHRSEQSPEPPEEMAAVPARDLAAMARGLAVRAEAEELEHPEDMAPDTGLAVRAEEPERPEDMAGAPARDPAEPVALAPAVR